MARRFFLPIRTRTGQRKRASLAVNALCLALAGAAPLAAAQSWQIPPRYTLGSSLNYGYDSESQRLHLSSLSHFTTPHLGSSMSWRSSSFVGGEIRYSALLSQHGASQLFAPSLRQRYVYQSVPVTFNAYAGLAQRTELVGRMGLVLSNPNAGGRQCLDASGRVYDCQSTPLTYGFGLRYDLHDSVRLRMDYDFLESRELSFGARSRSSYFSIGASYQY